MKTYKPIKKKPNLFPMPIEQAHRPRTSILLIIAACFIQAIAIWLLGSVTQRNLNDLKQLQQQIDQIKANDTQLEQDINIILNTPKKAATPTPVTGIASWLTYELPDSCAATLWPRGTTLHVMTDTAEVDCVVRDYGADPKIFPERIVDLNVGLFSQLADPSKGIINVTVYPSQS